IGVPGFRDQSFGNWSCAYEPLLRREIRGLLRRRHKSFRSTETGRYRRSDYSWFLGRQQATQARHTTRSPPLEKFRRSRLPLPPVVLGRASNRPGFLCRSAPNIHRLSELARESVFVKPTNTPLVR